MLGCTYDEEDRISFILLDCLRTFKAMVQAARGSFVAFIDWMRDEARGVHRLTT